MATSEPHRRAVAGEGRIDESEEVSVERGFEGKSVPSWKRQITWRALMVSLVVSVVLTIIVMRLSLTTGVIPSFNISAGLLGFFFVKMWTSVLSKGGFLTQPFTRQENTVIQTCVVSAASIAVSGGFGNFLYAMSETVARQTSEGAVKEYIDIRVGSTIVFLFLISFLGLFAVLPIRKVMIVDYKLPYPSGTATAHLINSFHTTEGAKLAKKQVKALGKFFSFSFLWGLFQWFFTAGEDCGFSHFPTFGMLAYQQRFYFDFSPTYVGVGMLSPYLVTISLLLGGILSWGIMWPYIGSKKGDWYSKDVANSMHGLQAYQVFIGIAMILGDGLYNFLNVIRRTLLGLYRELNQDHDNNRSSDSSCCIQPPSTLTYDDKRRTEIFLKDQLPSWFAITGYVTMAIVSICIVPLIIPQLKWYYILPIYIVAPVLGFSNAYGCGLTDWSLGSSYGKLAIFAIGAWAGESNGNGVIACLGACGVMMNIVYTASDLMQDFKTGYMTLTSPKSMLLSQAVGTGMGCLISPCIFWLFHRSSSKFGYPDSDYPVPFAIVYRNVAKLAVEGVGALPKNCLTLCYVFFAVAMAINLARDMVGKKWAKFIPVPMAMAIPFYIGSSFAIDMAIGSLILFIWQKVDKTKADTFAGAVASGLICGDGIWALPNAILALTNINPPMCMKFLSGETNASVDKFLQTGSCA